MFRAASTVGSATRPLLTFYGLSQAGRAIAAAAAKTEPGKGWSLQGHGLRSLNLEGALPEVEVLIDSRGSFVRLSEILDSPLWESGGVRLNDLWDHLPENEDWPLEDTGAARRTPLWIEHRGLHEEPHPLASVPVVRFPPWVLEAANKREALDQYLADFPEAGGYFGFERAEPGADAPPQFRRHSDGWCELLMHWKLPGGLAGTSDERLALLQSFTRPYKGTLYIFPVVGSNVRSLHPLMAWWALLYALSMLARYQPAEWAAHINIDTSPYAVAVERLLKKAIDILPRIILETIGHVVG